MITLVLLLNVVSKDVSGIEALNLDVDFVDIDKLQDFYGETSEIGKFSVFRKIVIFCIISQILLEIGI